MKELIPVETSFHWRWTIFYFFAYLKGERCHVILKFVYLSILVFQAYTYILASCSAWFCVLFFFFTLSHIKIFIFSFPSHCIILKSSVVRGWCLNWTIADHLEFTSVLDLQRPWEWQGREKKPSVENWHRVCPVNWSQIEIWIRCLLRGSPCRHLAGRCLKNHHELLFHVGIKHHVFSVKKPHRFHMFRYKKRPALFVVTERLTSVKISRRQCSVMGIALNCWLQIPALPLTAV